MYIYKNMYNVIVTYTHMSVWVHVCIFVTDIVKFILKYKDAIYSKTNKSMQIQSHKSVLHSSKYVYYKFIK